MTHTLKHLFHPSSVAVVGAANNPLKMGYSYFSGLVEMGVLKKLHPVNLTGEAVLGFKGYTSVKDIPGPLDYVICAIPARFVPEMMEDCVAKGVKFVHMFTAGMSETGEKEDAQLEAEIMRIARNGGIRVLGPNCMGVYSPAAGLTYYPGFTRESGNVAFVSQSGGLVERMIRIGMVRGIHFSQIASYGNAVDLNESDLVEYFAEDNESHVIGMYLEGVRDGRRLVQVLREAARNKPVVIMKGGRTEAGERAAASHTGSLTGIDEVWSAICQQSNLWRVYSLNELLDVMMTLLFFQKPRGFNVALIGEGGGTSVLASDDLVSAGLSLPPLPDNIRKKLDKFIPRAGTSSLNPVDSLSLFQSLDNLYDVITIVAGCELLDFIIVHIAIDLPPFISSSEQLSKVISTIITAGKHCGKPVALVLLAEGAPQRWEETLPLRQQCLDAGIPVYNDIASAAQAIGKFIHYHQKHSGV